MSGPLAGTTLVVKDVIDVEGFVTGAGNPTWAATHEPAPRDARCVQQLLDAGAVVVGKGQCAEFAYSLSGDNADFGMPENAAAPDRNPGGSTSGPAAAVGTGLCDVGLGTDTLGSVRVPRRTAACSDSGPPTARSASPACSRSRRRSTPSGSSPAPRRRWPPRRACWSRSRPSRRRSRACSRPTASSSTAATGEVGIFSDPDGYALGRSTFLTVQAYEVWRVYGVWVESHDVDFGPGVAERFAHAATVTRALALDAQRARAAISRRMLELVEDGAVLALPGIGPAPLRTADADVLQDARVSAGQRCCLASLVGLPAVMIPHGLVDGAPVGLQLVAAPGADRALLALAGEFIVR